MLGTNTEVRRECQQIMGIWEQIGEQLREGAQRAGIPSRLMGERLSGRFPVFNRFLCVVHAVAAPGQYTTMVYSRVRLMPSPPARYDDVRTSILMVEEFPPGEIGSSIISPCRSSNPIAGNAPSVPGPGTGRRRRRLCAALPATRAGGIRPAREGRSCRRQQPPRRVRSPAYCATKARPLHQSGFMPRLRIEPVFRQNREEKTR